MIPTRSRVLAMSHAAEELRSSRTAISLHSHTQHSKESLEFLPDQVKRIPVLGAVVALKLRRYEQRSGNQVDFRRAHWTPPISPAALLESEQEQIDRELGMAAVVSITDHDTIAAGLSLQQGSSTASIPISVEWSVPFSGDTLHLGVHHLPADEAPAIMAEMVRFTSRPSAHSLCELLEMLDGLPETLLVLNHPCWDVFRIGDAEHRARVLEFLSQCGDWIRALEINGLRSCRENRAVLSLAEKFDVPAVAGGDRHGRRPNTVLILTGAESWGEFVAEIRDDGQSKVIVLPSYEVPLALRQLEVVADALRYYGEETEDRRFFTDRTFVDLPGFSCHPLSFYWDRGVPLWLRPVLAAIVFTGRDSFQPILRRTAHAKYLGS